MEQNVADFRVPEEILAVIPTDPYEQLDLARKITSMAIASRVSRLEGETGRLRQSVAEKDSLIDELQGRLAQLDKLFQEADARLRTSLEENIKLSKERDSLALTAKKLSRELAKLEAFKRHLMQSLKEDDSSITQKSETVDIGTDDQAISKASDRRGSRNVPQKYTMVPYISPRLTPNATPKAASTVSSPKRFSAAVSPKMASGATSPTKRMEGQVPYSPWYPSSQLSSATSSPPRGRPLSGRPPRIDGKEFFRQTRSRLSYEQFGAFLANIKELNAHRQSREKAEEIFGTENKDLYLSFQGLLNRNVS
ncbi:unnamed protein product [Spirodela intermedia]|uniref:At4g15545-like C-terminal domain-containing protein n=1 Tax=Spirodela intermedia TaxID=51605 RepID=A0A7I8IKX6_SPIIN|nr:unnamed protein product [Spirodela intermedia]CAA6658043.1 unnamed protein product [Spirodela intermedia]